MWLNNNNVVDDAYIYDFVYDFVFAGSKVEARNHYRGHKLSMWLSLIPQLHSPGEIELSMRHHHFVEESAQYYDGELLNNAI